MSRIGDRDNVREWLTKARDWSSVASAPGINAPGMNKLSVLPEANRLLGILQKIEMQNSQVPPSPPGFVPDATSAAPAPTPAN